MDWKGMLGLIGTITGTVLGFSLSYMAQRRVQGIRARRMISAVLRELTEITVDISNKLAWVGRDVSNYMSEVDKDRVVQTDGRILYLGEREEFMIERPYWKAKSVDMTEVISDAEFSNIYKMYRLIDGFETKFREMKITFDYAWGTEKLRARMALACHDDLKKISEEINEILKNFKNRRARRIKLTLSHIV